VAVSRHGSSPWGHVKKEEVEGVLTTGIVGYHGGKDGQVAKSSGRLLGAHRREVSERGEARTWMKVEAEESGWGSGSLS
jgi:hypothetical protein